MSIEQEKQAVQQAVYAYLDSWEDLETVTPKLIKAHLASVAESSALNLAIVDKALLLEIITAYVDSKTSAATDQVKQEDRGGEEQSDDVENIRGSTVTRKQSKKSGLFPVYFSGSLLYLI